MLTAGRSLMPIIAHRSKRTSAPDYDWRNDPIPAGCASDHYPIAPRTLIGPQDTARVYAVTAKKPRITSEHVRCSKELAIYRHI